MAGPQDYLTVQGPSPASYSLPKFDLGSQIAAIPQSYQEGQQYGVKRALQTAFKDGFPTDQNGNPDYLAMAKRMLQIAGPEAAQPYFQMGLQQGNAEGNQALLGGQPQGQPQGTPQTYRPVPNAPNSATGPDGIRGPSTASTGSGSIFPYPPGTSPPQIVAGGPAPQPQGGAGLQGQPAPFAGNRDQQGAPPGPVGGGTPAFNDRVAQYGGMSNRPSVTEDGTTGQPTAPTSSRETANNGQQDRRIVAADRLDAQAAMLQAQAARYGQSPAAVKTLQDRAQQLADQAKQYREAALKDQALTDQQKTAIGSGRGTDVAGSEGDIEYQKKDAERFTKISGDISTAEKEAQAERPQLGLIKSIMADPGFYSGAAAGLVQKYRQWTVALGGDPKAGLPQEAFGKAVQNLALSQIRAMAGTGPVRVAEMRIIQQAIANKDYTPDTNRLLIEIADRNYARNQQIATMKRQYQAGPGRGRIDGGFEQQISAYDQQNPIFSPAELNDPRIIAPRRFRTPAEAQAAGLPPGTPYSDMTGKHLKMIQ